MATAQTSSCLQSAGLTDLHAGGAPEANPASRHFFIVARNNPSLYDYLRDQFTLDTNVEIVVDRRRSSRRTTQTSITIDRRRTDRRSRPDVDAELKVHTHVFLTLPPR